MSDIQDPFVQPLEGRALLSVALPAAHHSAHAAHKTLAVHATATHQSQSDGEAADDQEQTGGPDTDNVQDGPGNVDQGGDNQGDTTTAKAAQVFSNTRIAAAGTVDLTGSFVAVPSTAKAGKRMALMLEITNKGTGMATGTLSVDFGLSKNADGSSPVALSKTRTIKLKLKPGHHVKLRWAGVVPKTFAAGTYHAVANLDPTNAFHDTNLANNKVLSTSTINIT